MCSEILLFRCWWAASARISDRDVALFSTAAGVKKYVGGQLVATSIDVYLCLDFADGGDVRRPLKSCVVPYDAESMPMLFEADTGVRLCVQLFSMKGQLSAEEVRLLMWQVSLR